MTSAHLFFLLFEKANVDLMDTKIRAESKSPKNSSEELRLLVTNSIAVSIVHCLEKSDLDLNPKILSIFIKGA